MAGTVLTLPAASLILMREPYEVLMLRRHEKSSFVPNTWVFPGGINETADTGIALMLGDASVVGSMRVTAIRETFEETGVWLGSPLANAEEQRRGLLGGRRAFRELLDESTVDPGQLIWTSRWITPVGVPKRFDTYFFVARAPAGAEASAEQNEAVEVKWVSPAAALEQHAAGSMQMIFPTLRNLEAILPFESIEALLESRRDAVIEPIQPVLVNGKPALP